MIDIIEAGKFYNDCLKEVRKQIVEEKTSKENSLINFQYDIYESPALGYNKLEILFAFDINGTNICDRITISKDDKHKIIELIGNKIGVEIAKKMFV